MARGVRTRRPGDIAAAAVILIATLVYGTGALQGTIVETPDSATYWSTAASLGGGPGFARRPPLYPLLLQIGRGASALTGIGAARLVALAQSLLIGLSLALSWAITRRIYVSWRLAFLTLVVIAADQPLWQFARLILSENLCICLVLAATLAVLQQRATRAAIWTALASLTRLSAVGLVFGVGLAILPLRRGRWTGAAALRVLLAPIAAMIAGQALWALYGRLVIPDFTMAPANAAFGWFASASYCDLDLDAQLAGAGEVLTATRAESARRFAGVDPQQLRALGIVTWVGFDAMVRRFGEPAVGDAARRAMIAAPLRYAWCSARKSVVAIGEGAATYDYPAGTVDRPAWFSQQVDHLRLGMLSLLGGLTVIGFAGLVIGALRRRREALSLLALTATYLIWIGFAGQGDGELYRIRSVIDPLILAGLLLPLDPDVGD